MSLGVNPCVACFSTSRQVGPCALFPLTHKSAGLMLAAPSSPQRSHSVCLCVCVSAAHSCQLPNPPLAGVLGPVGSPRRSTGGFYLAWLIWPCSRGPSFPEAGCHGAPHCRGACVPVLLACLAVVFILTVGNACLRLAVVHCTALVPHALCWFPLRTFS